MRTQTYLPVVDVPPGVVLKPIARHEFVYTGPGDLGFLDSGEYKDKLYWHIWTKLVDKDQNYLGVLHPSGNPEYVQIRVRFSNGIKESFSTTPYFVNLTVRYLNVDQKHLESHPIGRMSVDKEQEHTVLIYHTPEWWASVRFIELVPLYIENGYSVGGNGIDWGGGGLPIFTF